jgi:hypothetical protein
MGVGQKETWIGGTAMHKAAVAIFYICGIISYAFTVMTLIKLAPL